MFYIIPYAAMGIITLNNKWGETYGKKEENSQENRRYTFSSR